MLVRILALFFVFFILQPWTRRWRGTEFAFLACTIVASSYWWPGLGKLRLNWMDYGNIYLLLPSAYGNGWLGFLEPTELIALTQQMARLDPLLIGFTLLVECGALFFLWRRPSAIAFLVGTAAFHLGIFAASGIFFWKWILANLGLAVLIWRNRGRDMFAVFTPLYFYFPLS